MSLARWLRGYDRRTEVLRGQWDLPLSDTPWLRRLVTAAADDPDLLDPYPLLRDQVRALASRLSLPIDTTEYDYYLEADEDWEKVVEARDAPQHI